VVKASLDDLTENPFFEIYRTDTAPCHDQLTNEPLEKINKGKEKRECGY
jgi:hypothetical protein